MGIMERFEQNIERVVNGAFARAFRSSVQPVELVSGLRREVDNKAITVARDRVIIPNAFTITLSEEDYDRFHDWESTLADELAESLAEHAKQQRYTFAGPIMIRFQRETHLDTGVFHIVSGQQRGNNQGQQPPAAAAPPRPVSPGQYTLEINGQRYPLNHGVTILGRGADAGIVVDDSSVSRHHAQVRLDTHTITLEDLQSTNGTFVNGQRITSVTVRPGDVMTIGRVKLELIPPPQGGS